MRGKGWGDSSFLFVCFCRKVDKNQIVVDVFRRLPKKLSKNIVPQTTKRTTNLVEY
ncbi:hypothetical protein ABH959_004935 [Bacillus sp. RC51]|nr:hypothetical protein IC3_02126 [Bacillus cereus VD142]